MDEPKEGATTLKKKAQEKLSAKENPVVSEPEADNAVSEVPAEVVTSDEVIETPAVSEPVADSAVSEVPAEVATPEAVVETEAPAADVAAE